MAVNEDGGGVTRIRGGTIVAFDGAEHRILEDGVLVYRDDRIVHVGRTWDGPSDTTVEADGMLVIPGQISAHAHVSAQEGTRLLVDGGRRDFFRTGFLHYLPARPDGGPSFLRDQDAEASLRFGLASLIRHGVTTVVAFAPGGSDGGRSFAEIAGEMGIRVYFAPLATSGRYAYDEAGRVRLAVEESAGLAGLEDAGEFIAKHDGDHDGRLRGIVVVDEFYTSTPALRRRASELAADLGVGLTLHFVEQVREFHETVTRTGRTPVNLLADEGILGPEVILAHAVYVAGHRATAYPYGDDLGVIAHSGASVAHSPLAFARRGVALESFQRYLDAGINLALGTDVYPLDLLAEMRAASMLCKVVDQNHEAASAAAVFEASNLGGARALGRDDLGRLAPGAKADIVIVDMSNVHVGPNPDPIRALVHLASGSLVDRVVVDGRTLVADGQLRVCDEEEVVARAAASSRRVWDGFAGYHWSGASVDEAFPPSLRKWTE